MWRNVTNKWAYVLRDSTISSVKSPLTALCQTWPSSSVVRLRSDLADDRLSQPVPTAKVLYDGECNICVHEISILRKLARKKNVDFVDISSPSFTSGSFGGVTYEQAMKEMHVISADGKVHVQGDAVREMYKVCGLGWLARATQLPGIREVCDKMYMKFARFRLEKALNRCDSVDSCSIKLKHLRDKLRPQDKL